MDKTINPAVVAFPTASSLSNPRKIQPGVIATEKPRLPIRAIIAINPIKELIYQTATPEYITNRTKHKAEKLALECCTKTLPFTQLANVVNEFEILFTATSASEPIITDAIVKPCSFDRYWFDLALPRDIECSEDAKIHSFVIDDLTAIVDDNLEFRENAARSAHGIIGRGVVEFFDWLSAQDIEPTIKELYLKANRAARLESKRAITKNYIPQEYEEEAQKMCEQALKTFLHEITQNIRSGSDDFKSELINGAMTSIMKQQASKN